jgi:hypothetical protein
MPAFFPEELRREFPVTACGAVSSGIGLAATVKLTPVKPERMHGSAA